MNAPGSDFFEHKTKVYLTLVFVPLCLYFKSLFYGFSSLDDQWMILNNAAELSNWHNLPGFFSKAIAQAYYRPLLNVSFMIDYQFGQLSPFIYHYTNLLLHLISVVLFFNFLKLVNTPTRLAFILALVFSVHPALTHAVAWIPGRNDLLLTVFVLCSINSFIKYLNSHHLKYIAAHFLFFAGALFTKENACMLVPCFMALAVNFKSSKKEQVLFTAAWLVVIGAWFLVKQAVVDSHLTMGPDTAITIKNFFLAFIVYTGKTIIPIQQSVFPTLNNVSLVPGIAALLLLGTLSLTFGFKNKTLACCGMLLFILMLVVPVWHRAGSDIKEHYEHRLYLPLLGLLLFISQLKVNANTKVVNYAAGTILLLFSVKTFIRMDAYKTELSFIEHGTIETPDYFLFHFQKGKKLFVLNDMAGALNSYNIAAKLQPARVEIYNSRANVYAFIKNYKEAINDYSTAIRLSPAEPQTYLNRCIAYSESGNFEKAIQDLEFLNQHYPGLVPPDLDDKITVEGNKALLEQLTKQILAQPKNAALYVKRAKVYLRKKLNAPALQDIKTACELEPANAEYKLYLSRLSPAPLP